MTDLGSDSVEYGTQPRALTMIAMSTMSRSVNYVLAASEIEPRNGNILCKS